MGMVLQPYPLNKILSSSFCSFGLDFLADFSGFIFYPPTPGTRRNPDSKLPHSMRDFWKFWCTGSYAYIPNMKMADVRGFVAAEVGAAHAEEDAQAATEDGSPETEKPPARLNAEGSSRNRLRCRGTKAALALSHSRPVVEATPE